MLETLAPYSWLTAAGQEAINYVQTQTLHITSEALEKIIWNSAYEKKELVSFWSRTSVTQIAEWTRLSPQNLRNRELSTTMNQIYFLGLAVLFWGLVGPMWHFDVALQLETKTGFIKISQNGNLFNSKLVPWNRIVRRIVIVCSS